MILLARSSLMRTLLGLVGPYPIQKHALHNDLKHKIFKALHTMHTYDKKHLEALFQLFSGLK